MRRELVAAMLDDVRAELFSDVIYTPVGGSAVPMDHAIFGPIVGTEDIDGFGQQMRVGTHVAYAVAQLFPALQRGDLLQEVSRGEPIGPVFRVTDTKPWGDGRLEVAVSLEPT